MAYPLLGDAHQQMGRSNKAVKTWRRLLEIRPKEAASYQQVSDLPGGRADRCGYRGLVGRAALGDAQLFNWELASLHLKAGLYTQAVVTLFPNVPRGQIELPVVEHQLGPPVE